MTRAITGDADSERCLENALELQVAVSLALLALELRGGFGMRLLESGLDLLPDTEIAHQDEVPRLHEANARRVVCGAENAGQHVLWDGIGQELTAHIATTEDGLVDRRTLGF